MKQTIMKVIGVAGVVAAVVLTSGTGVTAIMFARR